MIPIQANLTGGDATSTGTATTGQSGGGASSGIKSSFINNFAAAGASQSPSIDAGDPVAAAAGANNSGNNLALYVVIGCGLAIIAKKLL